ncbi:hypothetical protein [Flaviaesturariibacter amylovorans]|uniref:hypothetical protein n=1 Tax=Flaviaesturariibacter amylovorans TaxID=1084520 RepID=UPI0031EAC16D
MGKAFILIAFLLISGAGNLRAQGTETIDLRPIDVRRVERTFSESTFCVDSSGCMLDGCQVDLPGIRVEFYKAYLDRRTQTLRLVGRAMLPVDAGIYVSDNPNCFDKSSLLGYTSNSCSNLSNFGFFDIELVIPKNGWLFFSHPQTYCARFNIGRLLVSNKNTSAGSNRNVQ